MRVCEWCSVAVSSDRRPTAKTCSQECATKRRNARAAAVHRATYQRQTLPPKPCEKCGEVFTPYRSSSKFCSRRCQWSAKTIAERPRTRPCMKCGADTPTKPGLPVCADCHSDPRANASRREQARRLRAYGLTQGEYDQLVTTQGGRCAICSTDQPGGRKTWAIDHCHETGAVRGLLCAPCNMGIGQLKDSPSVLRAAADYIESARIAAVA